MNWMYLLIGCVLSVLGSYIFIKDIKRYRDEISNNKNDDPILTKFVIDYLLLGGIGFLGLLLFVLGTIFLISSFAHP